METAKLRNQLKAMGRRKRGVLRVYLVALDDSDGEKLAELDVGELRSEADRNDLAQQVYSLVQNHCDTAAVETLYRCRLTGRNAEEIAWWNMRQRPDPSTVAERDAPDGEADPPTSTGLVQMALRHSNEAVSHVMASHKSMVAALERQIAHQAREIEMLRKRDLQVTELARSILLQVRENGAQERVGEQIDRGIGLVGDFAVAIGAEMGLLPKGSKLSDIVSSMHAGDGEHPESVEARVVSSGGKG